MATPLCRCRVLYLGCAVPKVTKDGLQGIQDPLTDIYPDGGAADATGIDAWLSVWSNGILLEYLDSTGITVTKFMPVDTLHYCAAVRFVEVNSISAASSTSELVAMRFFPLDHPRATPTSNHHPPLFACIMRRTSGIKVLECHGFICKNEIAANALVKACFHAYSDSMNLRLYTDFTPHMIPVIIPKKKSIFKFGKKSRSKSIGPTLIPVHPVPMQQLVRSPSPSVNLDPYGYNRVYEWRTPTPRPVYLSAAPTPMFLQQQQPGQPVPAGDYRYINTEIPSSSSQYHDNPNRKHQLQHQSSQRAVWSSAGGSSSTGGSANGDVTYLYGSPAPPRTRQHSRVSSRGEDIYADIVLPKHRSRAKSPSQQDAYRSAMTSYQTPVSGPPREQYYEATTIERRKNGPNGTGNNIRSHKVDVENVSYHRNSSASVNNSAPTPAPYMNELERTLSNNGQHLHTSTTDGLGGGGGGRDSDRKLSTFKRYESMPELSHHSAPVKGAGVAASSYAVPPPLPAMKRREQRDLADVMNGMHLNGSAGSGDRTPASTPSSTPALSLSDYREPRKGASPMIPEADYHM
ncbi:hypothetical protein BV898_00866 [Hypsibius exemplaris]|uniref:PID domain-containing protein n=1 Tax=Hypsibius exemplaris TaxID=2072580 RepID=A0A1W0XCE1_HYPEX|nr:hypothetical protein BV898_00866 [Hypsibius exemplaris]